MIVFDEVKQLNDFLIAKGAQAYGLIESLFAHLRKQAEIGKTVFMSEFLSNRFSVLNSMEHLQWLDNEGKQIEIRIVMIDVVVEEGGDDYDPSFVYLIALDCDSKTETYFTYL